MCQNLVPTEQEETLRVLSKLQHPKPNSNPLMSTNQTRNVHRICQFWVFLILEAPILNGSPDLTAQEAKPQVRAKRKNTSTFAMKEPEIGSCRNSNQTQNVVFCDLADPSSSGAFIDQRVPNRFINHSTIMVFWTKANHGKIVGGSIPKIHRITSHDAKTR